MYIQHIMWKLFFTICFNMLNLAWNRRFYILNKYQLRIVVQYIRNVKVGVLWKRPVIKGHGQGLMWKNIGKLDDTNESTKPERWSKEKKIFFSFSLN